MRRLLLTLPLLAQMASSQQPPRGPGGPDPGFPYAQLLRAVDEKVSLLLDQGKTDAAIEELKRIPALNVPRDHPVYEGKAHLWSRLAMTYLNAGRKKEALETIKALLEEVPPGTVAEASAWLQAGTLYKQAGLPDDALKAFDRAIALSDRLVKDQPRPRPAPHP